MYKIACVILDMKRTNNINLKGKSYKLRNKVYFFAVLVFIIWICFLDDNNLWKQHKLSYKIEQLKKEELYFQEKIEKDMQGIEELTGSKERIEKYAREKYLMKNKDEDIFIIIDK